MVKDTEETGRDSGALVLTVIISDETDEAANAKWEHYKAGADLKALAYRDEQARDDPAPTSMPNLTGDPCLAPTSCPLPRACSSALTLPWQELAHVPGVSGVSGVMMTFDDFVIGMEQFGTRILPLMRCRPTTGASNPHAEAVPYPTPGRRMTGA